MILLENMDYQAGVEALLRSGYGIRLEQNHIDGSHVYRVILTKGAGQFVRSADDPKLALIEAYHAAENPEPVVAAEAAPAVEALVTATATIQAPVSVVVTDHDQFFGQYDEDEQPAEAE